MASSIITDYIGCGLAAARPATPSLATGSFGIYYATDTGAVSIWNGSSWSGLSGSGTVTSVGLSTPLGGGTVSSAGTLGTSSFTNHGVLIGQGSSALAVTGAGTAGQVLTSNGASADPTFQTPALTLITETVTSGTAASVTFSSIPATYRDLIIKLRGRGTDAGANVTVRVQFNSDTGTNYHYEEAHWFSTASAGNQATSQTGIQIGWITSAGATAKYAANIEAIIADYKGTTFYKSTTGLWSLIQGTAGFNAGVGQTGGLWLSTSAINAVKVYPLTGSFVDGTVVSLYGST